MTGNDNPPKQTSVFPLSGPTFGVSRHKDLRQCRLHRRGAVLVARAALCRPAPRRCGVGGGLELGDEEVVQALVDVAIQGSVGETWGSARPKGGIKMNHVFKEWCGIMYPGIQECIRILMLASEGAITIEFKYVLFEKRNIRRKTRYTMAFTGRSHGFNMLTCDTCNLGSGGEEEPLILQINAVK